MIRSYIRIGNDPIADFFRAYGFIYLEADKRTAPPEKEAESTSYAGEAGEHRDTRRVFDAFDYKVKLLVEAPNKRLENVNEKIAQFNSAIRETVNGVTRARELEFYNELHRVKIVGYPNLLSEPTDLYHSTRYGVLEVAVVEMTIRVSDPTKCDFSINTEIYADGADLVLPAYFAGTVLSLERWTRRRNSRSISESLSDREMPYYHNPRPRWGWANMPNVFKQTLSVPDEVNNGGGIRITGLFRDLVNNMFKVRNNTVVAHLNGANFVRNEKHKHPYVKLRFVSNKTHLVKNFTLRVKDDFSVLNPLVKNIEVI